VFYQFYFFTKRTKYISPRHSILVDQQLITTKWLLLLTGRSLYGRYASKTNASLNSGGAGKVEIQLVAQTGWVNRKYCFLRLAMRLKSDQDRKQIGCLVPWLRKLFVRVICTVPNYSTRGGYYLYLRVNAALQKINYF
jgi:hypothetical protein